MNHLVEQLKQIDLKFLAEVFFTIGVLMHMIAMQRHMKLTYRWQKKQDEAILKLFAHQSASVEREMERIK